MYKIENEDDMQQIVKFNEVISFEKIDEVVANNKLVQTYKVNLFNNPWFIFDFLVYASKCVKNYRINFANQQNTLVTNEYITNNFIFNANYIQKLCYDNKLNFAITLLIDKRGFTITKFLNSNQLLFITSLDDTGVNLTSIVDELTNYYLFYTQSEHIYSIIDYYNNNKSNKEIILSSGWLLIKYMLSLDEKQYDNFYTVNLKWIEDKIPNVKRDRKYWETLLNKIEVDLKK